MKEKKESKQMEEEYRIVNWIWRGEKNMLEEGIVAQLTEWKTIIE